MTTASRLLDELCHLAAQSLVSLDTSEHFQVVKLLGEGSYGHVKLALHKQRGTPMALKFFPRESTNLLSFLREYNLSLAFCSHPSLTSALGIAFSTPTHYVFAQQPSLHGDLFDVIVPEVGLGEDCTQRVASQISGALSHLHRLGFVHRDLKPENIFLCDRQCRWVKLGDFGMAKARGTRVPCVWYSSPYCTPEAEIARDSHESELDSLSTNTSGVDSGVAPLDENGNPVVEVKIAERTREKKRILVTVEPSTDTWALGMLIYAMLTGKLPWSETASNNRGYRLYKEWAELANTGSRIGHSMDSDEQSDESMENKENDDNNNCCPGIDIDNNVAPQFMCLTPLARSLLLSLLHTEEKRRGGAAEVEKYLGGTWLQERVRQQRVAVAARAKFIQKDIIKADNEICRVESRDR